MRLGVFGGSFDPVHNGHLALASCCQQQGALDEVWFVPTAVQPLKRQGPKALAADRVAMLRLATEDEPSWRVCTVEIDRGGPSYTVDTLRQLHEELPDASLFFLIGSDTLRDVEHWKEPEEIFRLATPLVVHRAGSARPDLTLLASFCADGGEPQIIEMQPHDVSSTEVRRRLAAGEAVGELVPAAVAAYLTERGLYSKADA